ncbi:MAG: flagella basal body P-ring formation protein FlgA [Fimbriimonadaceae bacterium]|nr:flagella basal body P-ring formation protein FlgA [Fimbriimonadaceae bacterium]
MKALSLIPWLLAGPLVAQELLEAPVLPVVPSIALRATAQVAGEQILCGEVAVVGGLDGLAALALAPAPLPGGSRLLTRDQIEVRLSRAGYRPETFAWSGADSVVVTRLARQVTIAELNTAIATLVPLPLELERLSPRRALPAGALSFRLRAALPEPLPERFNLLLDVLVDGRTADSLTVAVRRPAPPAAPLATEPAPTVPAADPLPAPAIPPAPAASSATPAPAPAAPAAPRPTWQVKRGDQLTVLAISGKVRIGLAAEAREAGGYGDTIQCQALVGQEKRVLAARLVSPDTAVLEF